MRAFFPTVLSILFITIFGQHISDQVVEIPHKKKCREKPITIAIIDTGFDASKRMDGQAPKLCKYGHRDFTGNQSVKTPDVETPIPVDVHGHGTHIAGIVDRYAREGGSDYCLVIIKYFHNFKSDPDKWFTLRTTIAAINYARNIHVDFINLSGGGIDDSKGKEHELEKELDELEAVAVRKYLDDGGTFVSAAGNERSDLAKKPYYPAVDDSRIVVVGNGFDNSHHAPSSNYGERVDRWENGENVLSILPNNDFGYMSGTSQAAAIATGKLVAEKLHCK